MRFFHNLFSDNKDIEIRTVTNSIRDNIIKLTKSDVIQIISADLVGFYGFAWCLIFIFLRVIRKPIIFYWIGSDVTISNKRMLWFSNLFITKHICIAPWLVDELKEKGISAEFYPNPIPHDNTVPPPLPENFTVLAYLGAKGREEFYGSKIINRMIKQLPYHFIVLGAKKLQNIDNVRYLDSIKYKDMKQIYADTTVLVRITKHDGFSNMVQEALNYGRHVVWSKEYPYCLYADNYDSVVSSIEKIRENTTLNISGMEYYRKQFNLKENSNRFVKMYVDVLKWKK